MQAIWLGSFVDQEEILETVKTNERGFYQFSNLRVGRYKIVCHTADKLIGYTDHNQIPTRGIFDFEVENQYLGRCYEEWLYEEE